MTMAIDSPIQVPVGQILTAHPRLVDDWENRLKADPFVIALAKMKGFAVVTGEKPSGNSAKPRIPDVCDALDPRRSLHEPTCGVSPAGLADL